MMYPLIFLVPRRLVRHLHAVRLVLLVLLTAPLMALPPLGHAAESVTVLPAPVLDATPSGDGLETAVLAGGCFWGVQAVFAHVKGVTRAFSGYAGGTTVAPTYDAVSEGATGHAEVVEVTFDPRNISYGSILQIYFAVAHNPTQLNAQGPDVGTQYRSAIFTTNVTQQRIAEAYITQLNTTKVFKEPIVTTVSALQAFYPAEDDHQDYAFLHPTERYIVINDRPKVMHLQRLFAERYRESPVLVRATQAP